MLGQVALGFELSIAQILAAVLTAGLLEAGIVRWRQRRLVWPASAMLTGNGVALLLRVPGTRHGDWWSTRGALVFAGVAAASVLSKYLVRLGGRHVFNPSNLGLVACFVLLGSRRVDPQDLWWGPPSWGLVVALAVIAIGAVAVTGRLRMLGMAAAYWVVLAASVGVLALGGHTMTARWRVGVLDGPAFWWAVVASPEVLVFAAFMITDPKTSPVSRRGRVLFGVAAALAGAVLMAPARSEFSVKLAILGGLAVVTAARAAGLRLGPATRSVRWSFERPLKTAVVAALVAPVVLVAGTALGSARPDTRISSAAPAVPAAVLAHLPPVVVDAEAERLDPGLTLDRARRMAAAVAATVDDPGAVRSLTVVVVRDPNDTQAPPKLGVRCTMTTGDQRVFGPTFFEGLQAEGGRG